MSHTRDELLVSLVARLGALNSIQDPKELMEAVTGRRTAMISLDLPTNLNAIAGRLPESVAIATPSKMFELSTLYPYFRPFALPHLWERVVQSAMTSAAPGMKLRLGLTCHGFGASMGFRFCHACSIERWKLYGSIAWTRACNLPEVVVCPDHCLRLVEGTKQSTMSFRQKIPMPDLRTPSDSKDLRNLSVITRFAELSRELLWCGRKPVDIGARLRVFREALRKHGFIRGKDQIRWVDLSSYLLTRHNCYEGFSSQRHLSTQRNGVLAWLPSVLSPRKSSHPVVNLLLIDALFEDLSAFFSHVDADVGGAGSTCVNQRRGKTGMPDDPGRSALRDRVRQFWIELHRDNPMLSTSQLRPHMSAQYAWLYRNDRQWLHDHSRCIQAPLASRPKPRVQWAQRDVEYSTNLKACAEPLLSRREGRPFTKTRLIKMIGPETTLRKHLHELPNLCEMIESLLAQSRQDYLVRRSRRFSQS